MKLLSFIFRKLMGQPNHPTDEEAARLNAQAERSL
jgi:hypothetical protein